MGQPKCLDSACHIFTILSNDTTIPMRNMLREQGTAAVLQKVEAVLEGAEHGHEH